MEPNEAVAQTRQYVHCYFTSALSSAAREERKEKEEYEHVTYFFRFITPTEILYIQVLLLFQKAQ